MDDRISLSLAPPLLTPSPLGLPPRRSLGFPPGGWWSPLAERVLPRLGRGEAWEAALAGGGLRGTARASLWLAILAPGLTVRVGDLEGRGLAAGRLHPGEMFDVEGQGGWVQILIGSEGASLARDLPVLPTHIAAQALGEPWEAWVEVSPQSSREGIRLLGGDVHRPPLTRSEPAIRGLIQAPSPGVLLVHGPEGPTTGGYGRAGVLDDLALTQAAAKPPGSRFLLRATPEPPPQSEHLFRSLIEGVFG